MGIGVPWRGPRPVRSTVAAALNVLGLAVGVVGFASVDLHARTVAWPLAAAFTLLSASAFVRPAGRLRGAERALTTLFAALQWWFVYRSAAG